MRSGFLVNRLLSQVDRWESIFTVFRDLEPLFDHINLSTALHRLARTSYKHRVRPLRAWDGHWMPCRPSRTCTQQQQQMQACLTPQLQAWLIRCVTLRLARVRQRKAAPHAKRSPIN